MKVLLPNLSSFVELQYLSNYSPGSALKLVRQSRILEFFELECMSNNSAFTFGHVISLHIMLQKLTNSPVSSL